MNFIQTSAYEMTMDFFFYKVGAINNYASFGKIERRYFKLMVILVE
jgi:hypothetical protein